MDFGTELLDQTRAFGDLTLGADPDAPVPTCPGWTVKQLFRHVGRGNRWAAHMVGERAQDNIDPTTVPNGKPPGDAEGAGQWLREGAQLLVDAVADVGPGAEVWTFTGPRPAAWWLRRRLHEVAVHRADAAIAVGADFDLSPALAADGLSEWLDIVHRLVPQSSGRSVHLHATDADLGDTGEWTIADGAVTNAHGKADVALRGPARDLLLITTRRRAVGDTAVEVFGDETVLQTWLDGMKF